MAYGSSSFGSESFGGSSNQVLLNIKTFFLDAKLVLEGIEKTYTIDARLVLNRTGTTLNLTARVTLRPLKTFTLDSAISKNFSKTFTIGGYRKENDITKTFTLDSRTVLHQEKTSTIDSAISKNFTKTFSFSARCYVIKYWLSGWKFRKSIAITNSISTTLTQFQVKVIVHKGVGTDTATDVYCNSNVKDDFSDIRFTKQDGKTPLKYWIQKYTSGDNATVWILIDYIPANPNSTSIYLYYGNYSASSESDRTTMIFADDFTGDLSNWNIVTPASVNIEIESSTNRLHLYTFGTQVGIFGAIRANITDLKKSVYGNYIAEFDDVQYTRNNIEDDIYIGLANIANPVNQNWDVQVVTQSQNAQYGGHNESTKPSDEFQNANGISYEKQYISDINWNLGAAKKKIGIAFYGSSVEYYIDDVLTKTGTVINDNAFLAPSISLEDDNVGSAEDMYFESVFVRKYETAPVTVFGSQEGINSGRGMSRTHRVGLRIVNG